jgi:hypothetical protein
MKITNCCRRRTVVAPLTPDAQILLAQAQLLIEQARLLNAVKTDLHLIGEVRLAIRRGHGQDALVTLDQVSSNLHAVAEDVEKAILTVHHLSTSHTL